MGKGILAAFITLVVEPMPWELLREMVEFCVQERLK